MKDIPVFTTPFGVASLILKEIPYRQEAYIHVQAVEQGKLDGLLEECIRFCRMAGAEKVYACGHEGLEKYPLYCAVLEMSGTAWVDSGMLENLFPVTDASVSGWRTTYNERMKEVDNALTLTKMDEKRILESGGAYFVHHEGDLLGIGWLDDPKLLAIASVKKGAGERVAHTLMSLVEGDRMTLEVASTNQRAISLYEKLGFMKTAEKNRWYQVR